MRRAVECCGNLVFIEEEQQTVHFIHSSVQQYLRSKVINGSPNRYYIDLEKADADAGAICVTYLNFPIFNAQVVRTNKLDITTAGIPSEILKNSLPAGRLANRMALELLNRRDKSSKSVQRLLEETAGDDELRRRNAVLEQYSFFPYAQQFWLAHTKQRIIPSLGKLWKLWCNLLEDASWRNTLSNSSWTVQDWQERSKNVVQWTVDNEHCSLAQLLIMSKRKLTEENLQLLICGAAARGCAELVECSLDSMNVPQKVLDFGLQLAAESGLLSLVERLLEEKADANAALAYNESYAKTALQAAAQRGHLAIVERLLEEKADVNAAADWMNGGRTALQAAAQEGHLAIVERLLEEKADVHFTDNYYGGNALQAAAERGHLAIVERLLEEKIDVNAADNLDRIAFQLAAQKDHLAVVQRLLEEKIDANVADFHVRIALALAADMGQLAVVERLLEWKADINAADDFGRTPLQLAAQKGHLAVVERLLEEKADVNVADKSSITALQLAAQMDHLAVVERLLEEKADVNAADNLGRTAFQLAAQKGHLAVVERLLEEKVDANITDFCDMIALHLAATWGHLAVVERLLEWKADINAADRFGRTALQLAAARGHSAIVERLKAAGAKKKSFVQRLR